MPGAISSLVLIIVGSIARYAYSDSVYKWHTGSQVHSLQIDTIGLILLLAGVVGLLLSVLWSLLRPKYSVVPIKTRRHRTFKKKDETK